MRCWNQLSNLQRAVFDELPWFHQWHWVELWKDLNRGCLESRRGSRQGQDPVKGRGMGQLLSQSCQLRLESWTWRILISCGKIRLFNSGKVGEPATMSRTGKDHKWSIHSVTTVAGEINPTRELVVKKVSFLALNSSLSFTWIQAHINMSISLTAARIVVAVALFDAFGDRSWGSCFFCLTRIGRLPI